MEFSEYGINVAGLTAGPDGEVRAVCPECTPGRKAHNRNAKDLAVNVEKGTWFCHHCGWAGGLSDKQETAYRRPEYKRADLPLGVIEWFAKRGISETVLADMQIGYDGNGRNGWIQFPFIKRGQVVNVKSRTADKQMRQEKEAEPCFYNHDGARKAGGDTLVICEGEIDALTFIEAGVPAVVSVPNGAPAPNAKNFDKAFAFLARETPLLESFERVILAVDNDQPGKLLEHELSKRIGKDKCLLVSYPADCKDANDVLVKHGTARVRELILSAYPCPIDGLFTPSDMMQAVMELYDQGLRGGASTGWGCVDRCYTVRPCEMTIVTGMPGSGKSTWIDALAVNLWRNEGWKFAYCSPENWPIQRHIASIAEKVIGKPFATHGRNMSRMSHEEASEAVLAIQGNFFFTQLPEEEMGLDNIIAVMQAAITRHAVNGIILDPWNELEPHRPQDLSETEFISQTLGRLRRFARLNNVHVWIVAHPTKLQKNKETGAYPVPTLYDISGSAHWRNKADNGITVHRPDPMNDVTEIHVGKIRFKEVGQVGCAQLRFSRDTGTYSEPGLYSV